MKKVLSLILVALMVLGVFTASAVAEGGKTHITFSMWDPMPADNNFIQAFMDANPDVDVEILQFPDDNYSTKLNTMVATNSAPDVMLVWECDIPVFAGGEKILKLDDYITDTSAFTMDDLLPAMVALQDMNDGSTYGLPWCWATQIMYYNKDMFDAAGVAYPTDDWTWEDYTNAAIALTVRDGDSVSQWGDGGLGHVGSWYSMVGAGGDDIVGADGKLAIGAGAEKALQFQYDLINTHKVSPEVSSESSDLFAAGRAAMFRTGSWMTSAYRDVPFNWDICTLPSGERKYAGLHTGFFTINAQCENPDVAWRLIEFCMSDAGQEFISKGFGNPAAKLSLNDKGFYRVQGANGPTNWDTFDKSGAIAEFGYTLLPAGVTNDLQKKFEAAAMGQETIAEAIEKGVAEALKVLEK